MAYMSQEQKNQLAPAIKAVLAEYGVKGTIAVRNHSTLVVNLKSGALDLIGNHNAVATERARIECRDPYLAKGYMDVNHYHVDSQFSGRELEFVTKLLEAMSTGNWDDSDPQTDYFNVGWYVDINIGKWDKAYEFIAPPADVVAESQQVAA